MKPLRLARIPQTFAPKMKRKRRVPRPVPQPATTAWETSFELPWPTSVNLTYLPNGRGGKRLAPEARAYRATVVDIVQAQKVPAVTLPERLRVHVVCYQPDFKRRDLGNLDKTLQDALQHAGVIRDDGDIDDLRFYRHRGAPGALRVVVTIGQHLEAFG